MRARRSARLAAAALACLAARSGSAATLPADFNDALFAMVPAPTALAFTPDGRVLVTSQTGELRVFDQKGAQKATALTLAPICSNSERGLLGIAVDPAFASNDFVYVYYTANIPTVGCKNRVSRFTLPDTNVVDPASELILLDNIRSTHGNHNAGDLHFGNDGNLYVSVGDGGCDYKDTTKCGGQNAASRDENVLNGKILRITPTGDIPADNPFQGPGTARCGLDGGTMPGSRCQETYAWGFRNPFRFALDPGDPSVSGQRLFVNDVGQDMWEEIDSVSAGSDYGWNCREGAHGNPAATNCAGPPPGAVDPIHEYSHTTGCGSITGATFVPAGVWPNTYTGAYLFADYVCGRIARLSPNGKGGFVTADFVGDLGGDSAVEIAFGPAGANQALYYTTYANGGSVRRIRFTGVLNHPPVAAFVATPRSGAAPLEVAFDGSGSRDADKDALTYVWDFGDGGPPAETTTPTTSHLYPAIGSFTATLRVRDARNALSDPTTVAIDVSNSPPLPVITSPPPGALFAVGQALTLSGTATDLQDGVLATTSLTWEVVLHHETHTHPFLPPTPGNDIPIVAPAPEDLAAVGTSFLEIRLTATDGNGLARTVVRNVMPHVVPVLLLTTPPGLGLRVNGLAVTAPVALPSWEGYALDVLAPTQVDAAGHGHSFTSWSDGGGIEHAIVTPASPSPLTALFDLTPALAISNATVAEGNAGATPAVFTVTLSDPAPGAVTVDYATLDGTATAGSDYAATGGTLTFAPGVVSQTIAVDVLGDTAVEGTESFFVRLSGASGALTGVGRGEGFILDDDGGARFELAADAYRASESSGGVTVTVNRTGDLAGSASVDYGTLDGTATAPDDYATTTGTLAFGPGVKSRTFRVPIAKDALAEGDETVLLRLSNPGPGAALGTRATAVLTIADDDAAGSIAFGATAYAARESDPQAIVTVKRVGGAAGGVTVDYATADGTATAGLDYTPVSGILSFAPGVTSRTFTVPLLDDGVVEGNETVVLSLDHPLGGATLASPSEAVLTIQEGNPVFQFSAPAYAAGEGGGRATITVVRSGPAAGPAAVSYATSDGTAVQGVQYTSTSGTLTFGPGVASRTFAVPILETTRHEDASTVLLSLSAPSPGASVGPRSTAVLTLRDDDPAGSLRFTLAGYSVSETKPAVTIGVRRTGGTASDVTVAYATSDGTARAGVNYAPTSGTLSFGRGVASDTFTVPILDDGAPNGDLTFGVALSAPAGGASLGVPAAAQVTIVTPDPTLEFASATYNVGAAGPHATIAVRRSGPLAGTVTASYATSDGTATAGTDYTGTTGTLTFGPGVVTQTFAVAVSTVPRLEGNATVDLALTAAGGGAALGPRSTAVLTIAGDDPTVAFTMTAYSAGENAKQASVSVRRSGPMMVPVSVQYATADGTAEAGTDYVATSGLLSFPAGAAVRTFTVPLSQDSGHEGPETVLLALSNPLAAVLGTPAAATLTIRDDDAAGIVQFESAVYSASAAGPTATITVARAGGVASGASVDYATADGSALAGVDYRSSAGTLVFAAGQQAATFTIDVMDDLASGPNKTVNLVLTRPQGGAALGPRSSAVLWVVENR